MVLRNGCFVRNLRAGHVCGLVLLLPYVRLDSARLHSPMALDFSMHHLLLWCNTRHTIHTIRRTLAISGIALV